MFRTRPLVPSVLGILILAGTIRSALFLGYAWEVLPCAQPAFHLEGASVHFAWRAQHGVTLYPKGDCYPYTLNLMGPVYFWTVGALGRLGDADVRQLTYLGRAVSFLACLAAGLLAAVFLYRRHGTLAALVGGCFAIGSAPLVGFAVMARPDMLAELLGVTGFLIAAYCRGRRAGVAAGVVLGLACLTKQTSGVYAIAAVLAVWASERDLRRVALVGATTGATALGIIAAAVLTVEPRIVPSLFGQGAIPLDPGQRLCVLGLLARSSPDLLWFGVLGCWFWTSGTGREPKLAILSAVLLGAALVTSAKLGSDLNYFLGLRLIEIVAIGSMCSAAVCAEADRRWQPIGILTVGVAFCLISTGNMAGAFHRARAQSAVLRTDAGRDAMAGFEAYCRMAEDPNVSLFTDSDRLAARQGDRAAFLDAYLFRLRVTRGRLDPAELSRRIASRGFDVIILSADVDSGSYRSYFWRLPEDVAAAIRSHYSLAETKAGFYVYLPNVTSKTARGSRDVHSTTTCTKRHTLIDYSGTGRSIAQKMALTSSCRKGGSWKSSGWPRPV